jgi:hypothetical protein
VVTSTLLILVLLLVVIASTCLLKHVMMEMYIMTMVATVPAT